MASMFVTAAHSFWYKLENHVMELSFELQRALLVALCSVGLLSLVLNGIILFMYRRFVTVRMHAGMIAIAALAVVDLSNGATALLGAAYKLYTVLTPNNSTTLPCYLMAVPRLVSIHWCVSGILLIAVDRLCALRFATYYIHWNHRRIIGHFLWVTLLWATVAVGTTAVFVDFDGVVQWCNADAFVSRYHFYYLAVYLNVMLVSVISLLAWLLVLLHRYRQQRQQQCKTSANSAPTAHRINQDKKRQIRATFVVSCVLVAYVCLIGVPTWLFLLSTAAGQSSMQSITAVIVSVGMLLNSAINFFIYWCTHRLFAHHLKLMFTQCCIRQG